MAINWTNPGDLKRDIDNASLEYDRKAVVFLSKVGEIAVKKARELGSYKNRTSHLRNSISYLVVQNGVVKVDAFGATEPQQETRTYAMNVAKEHRRGTVLIWAAGKKYAKYVEAKGYDVLAGSGNYLESMSDSLVREFENYLKSA